MFLRGLHAAGQAILVKQSMCRAFYVAASARVDGSPIELEENDSGVYPRNFE
jgi:hypothetical protein